MKDPPPQKKKFFRGSTLKYEVLPINGIFSKFYMLIANCLKLKL